MTWSPRPPPRPGSRYTSRAPGTSRTDFFLALDELGGLGEAEFDHGLRGSGLVHRGACQAGGVEQRVELLDRALLTGARHEHHHIRQCGMWIRLVDDHVDNGDSASWIDRVPAFLKDLDALLVRPVVQDELEQQQVPCRDG